MNGEKCEVCRFFDTRTNYCRQQSPYVLASPYKGQTISAWPTVANTDWCGDFQQQQGTKKK